MSRRWEVGAAIATIATAVAYWWLIPEPRPAQNWREWGWEHDSVVLGAIRTREPLRQRANLLERRWEYAEARASVAPATSADGLTLVTPGDFPPARRTALEAAARAELRLAGVQVPKHPVTVRVLADTGRDGNYRYRRFVVLPSSATDPCGIVLRAPSHRLRSLELASEDRLLGTCAFYAAFGDPGAGMARWLRDTRATTAAYLTPPPTVAADTALLDATWRRYYSDELLVVRGCRAHVARACEMAMTPDLASVRAVAIDGLSPGFEALWEDADVVPYGAGVLDHPAAPVTFGLLGALAADLGERRFAAIWTSDLAPPEAFERLEARPLAAWMDEHVAREVRPYRRGPGPALPQMIVALALLGTLVVASTRLTRRELS